MKVRGQWILSAAAVPLVIVTGYGLGAWHSPPPAPLAALPPLAAGGTVAEYPSMTALRKVEPAASYDLTWTITGSPLIVIAPHGGSIEPRTSEIATAIAGTEHTQCQFKGKLPAGQNARLHVTSEHWDVEECLILIGQRTHALSIHGTAKAGEIVYLGGRDTTTGAAVKAALAAKGFTVEPAPSDVAGTSPDNFVNKDADGAGVQLELTTDLRNLLFPAKEGPPSTRGDDFVNAVRSVYA